MNEPIPLIVTTAHKGVFFGYGQSTTEKTITIERARMCVYWSADVKGVVGLAVTGPTKDCRVGPAAQRITLMDVTAIMEPTAVAVVAWEGSPWAQ